MINYLKYWRPYTFHCIPTIDGVLACLDETREKLDNEILSLIRSEVADLSSVILCMIEEPCNSQLRDLIGKVKPLIMDMVGGPEGSCGWDEKAITGLALNTIFLCFDKYIRIFRSVSSKGEDIIRNKYTSIFSELEEEYNRKDMSTYKNKKNKEPSTKSANLKDSLKKGDKKDEKDEEDKEDKKDEKDEEDTKAKEDKGEVPSMYVIARKYIQAKLSNVLERPIEQFKRREKDETYRCYIEELKRESEEIKKGLMNVRKRIKSSDDRIDYVDDLINRMEKCEARIYSILIKAAFTGREQLAYFMRNLASGSNLSKYLVPYEIFNKIKHAQLCPLEPSDLVHHENPLVYLARNLGGTQENEVWKTSHHFRSGICDIEVDLAYHKVDYQQILNSFGSSGGWSYNSSVYDDNVLHCSNNWKVKNDVSNYRVNLSHLDCPAAKYHRYKREKCNYNMEQLLTRYFGLDSRSIDCFSDGEIVESIGAIGSKHVKTVVTMMWIQLPG